MLRKATLIAAALVAACASGSPSAASEAGPASGGASSIRRVGTMSELMADFIYPASDAVFYIASRTPSTSEEWAALQAQTLMLAESANLLMLPHHARDQDRWMADARLMLDAGEAAYHAAKERDVSALEAVSDPLYESCVTCHEHYRPDYGRQD